MHQSELDFTNNLRQASPYIAQHQGKTVVIYVPGSLVSDSEQLKQFAQDIVLLNNLGVKVVLTLGASEQIDQAYEAQGVRWQAHQGVRVTEASHLKLFQEVIGGVRANLEAAFSLASAEQHLHLPIVSGNWVIAQPKGVVDGVDYQHTGLLRKLNLTAIEQTLNAGQVVLLTPLAYSLTGEVFNLNTLDQAFGVAKAIQADKLMLFMPEHDMVGLPKSLSLNELNAAVSASENAQQQRLLALVQSCRQTVKRIHVMPQQNRNALLMELFSRDGAGTLIYTDRYHQIRTAEIEDVVGIMNLISPLEQQGVLVKRSREVLELEIGNFSVVSVDGQVIGCAALYPLVEGAGELACLAIETDYQGQSLGEQLLAKVVADAKQQGMTTLFLLTTHTHHWFIEHGFQETAVSALPVERQQLYNHQRQSKVLYKSL